MTRVAETSFSGAETILVEPGAITPLPADEWSGRIRWLRVDGARADYVELGPHRFEVPAHAERDGVPAQMMLLMMVRGTTTGEVDGEPVVLQQGQGALLDGRAAMRFRAEEPVRAMRILVDEQRLPAEARFRRTPPFALLKDSPLVTGCIGFVSGLLQLQHPHVEPHDEVAVSQPLIALLTSLLDVALHTEPALPSRPHRGEARRRDQVEAYIDEHLAEPDLSPVSIADALGLSVRSIHAAFADETGTVAALIRARRVERAKALLLVRAEPPGTGALAARVGLSTDQLTRSFRAATGETPRRWWQRHGTGPRGRA